MTAADAWALIFTLVTSAVPCLLNSKNIPIKRGARSMTLPQRLSDILGGSASREVAIGRRPVPARVVRAVDHGVAVEHGRGIVMAARARALEHVAEEAMHAAGRVSQSEAFWSRHCPHGAARFQAIADLAAMGLADIVADMGRE